MSKSRKPIKKKKHWFFKLLANCMEKTTTSNAFYNIDLDLHTE